MKKTISQTLSGIVPVDKQLHALTNFFLATVLLEFESIVPWCYTIPALIALGAYKEHLDTHNSFEESTWDMVANMVGISAALAVFFL